LLQPVEDVGQCVEVQAVLLAVLQAAPQAASQAALQVVG
jgi:hypothetical protein